MLCRNCNYILSGKENFCPNCGTIPSLPTQAFPTIRKLSPDAAPPDEENNRPKPSRPEKKDFIFADSSVFHINNTEADTEEDAEELTPAGETEERKKGSTAKILILLFIFCTLATTAFVIADRFDIIPDFSALVSSFGSDTQPEQPQTSFSHSDTVIEPEINYPMTTAYVLSGNGLALRKGPGNGYAPLHSLTDLTQVQIFGGSLANTNWLYVYCGEKECYGWVDGSFLCSEAVAKNELTNEYEDYEDVPTAYYRDEEEEEYSEYI